MSFGKELKSLEKIHCLTGKLPEGASVNQELYALQVGPWDVRKSEAVLSVPSRENVE